MVTSCNSTIQTRLDQIHLLSLRFSAPWQRTDLQTLSKSYEQHVCQKFAEGALDFWCHFKMFEKSEIESLGVGNMFPLKWVNLCQIRESGYTLAAGMKEKKFLDRIYPLSPIR